MTETNTNKGGEKRRACAICCRGRKQGEFLVVLNTGEVRCSSATDCAVEIERQRVAGVERHLACRRCRRVRPLREVRIVQPGGSVQCLSREACKVALKERAAVGNRPA